MEALEFSEKYPNLSKYLAFKFEKGKSTRKTLVNMKKDFVNVIKKIIK